MVGGFGDIKQQTKGGWAMQGCVMQGHRNMAGGEPYLGMVHLPFGYLDAFGPQKPGHFAAGLAVASAIGCSFAIRGAKLG